MASCYFSTIIHRNINHSSMSKWYYREPGRSIQFWHQGFNWEKKYNFEAEYAMVYRRTARTKAQAAESWTIGRRTQLNIRHRLHRDQCRHVGKLLTVSKITYFSNKMAECGCSPKDLFRIAKNLMGHKREIILPSFSSGNDLANTFCDCYN